MTIEEVKDFLSKVQPFDELDEVTLKNIAGGVIVEFYPKDSMILHQDGPPSDFLRIIKKGGAKILIRPAFDEIIVNYIGERDLFGLFSLIGGDRNKADVIAVMDTTCFLFTKETIQGLIESKIFFADFFSNYE